MSTASTYVVNLVDESGVTNAPSGTYRAFINLSGVWRKVDDAGNITDISAADFNDKVKISALDTTEGFLEDKVTATVNKIAITKINPGANEQFVINIGTDVFDKTVDNTDDLTEGAANFFMSLAQAQAADGANSPSAANPFATVNDLKPAFNITLDSADANVTRVVAGGRTTFTVTHSLNTLDLKPEVFRLSDGRTVGWRVERTGVNTVEASRNGNVANGLFRIVI